MKENNSSEDIDLLPIFRSIKKEISNLFILFMKFINFSILNRKILIFFIIIGIGISVGVFYIKKTVYFSALTISHKRLNNSECNTLINGLTIFSNNKDFKMLAEKLNIDTETAKQIKSINYKPLNEVTEKNYKDSIRVFLPFKLEVETYNIHILDSLENKILNYLESNEYAAKRKKLNKEYLDNYETKIKTEIIAIDSLKQIVNQSIIPRSGGNGIILGEPIDPVAVHQAGMNLYQTELSIIEQKEFNNSFEILLGFTPPIPAASLLFYIFIGIITSLITGFLWLLRTK